ncbi:MAG: glycosyltransferase [Planctomycetota bacterium]
MNPERPQQPLSALVVHLLTADAPEAHLDTLRVLLAHMPACVLHIGPGSLPAEISGCVRRVPSLLAWRPVRTLALCRKLRSLLPDARAVILHAWTPQAAEAALPLVTGCRPLVIETAGLRLGRRTVGPSLHRLQAAPAAAFICPTQVQQRRLAALGIAPARCVVIGPATDQTAIAAAARRRTELRGRLGFNDDQVVVLAVPPAGRDTGTLLAAWAAFVLEKVRHDVRLLLPDGDREGERVRRLVDACRHGWMVRHATPALRWAELLAVADIAAFLPSARADVDALAGAAAAGVPLVASDLPEVREVVGFTQSAGTGAGRVQLCRPGDPADATRKLLNLIESRARPRARPAEADGCSAARAIEQYRQVYVNLAARRPAAAR